MPDASISPSIITKDIQDAKAAGVGGLEILYFYLYGMGQDSYNNTVDLPDWGVYGFGTAAYKSQFKDSLQSAKDAEIVIDFALGANQGQGVPSEVGDLGLAVELLMGVATVLSGGRFEGPVPQARQPSEALRSGMGFMHPLEQFGTPNLTALVAYQVLSMPAQNSSAGSSLVHLNETSFIDLTSFVQADGTLQWTPSDGSKTWRIFTFWEAYTNQRSCDGGPSPTDFISNGSWTVDHFSKRGAARVTDFWDEFILSDDETTSLVKSVGKYCMSVPYLFI